MSDYQGVRKTIRARKVKCCSWCGQYIESGELYESTFIVSEGDAWTRKMHIECSKAEQAYDYDGEVLYYSGQFERGHNHEYNADTVENNAKNNCPSCIKQTKGGE